MTSFMSEIPTTSTTGAEPQEIKMESSVHIQEINADSVQMKTEQIDLNNAGVVQTKEQLDLNVNTQQVAHVLDLNQPITQEQNECGQRIEEGQMIDHNQVQQETDLPPEIPQPMMGELPYDGEVNELYPMHLMNDQNLSMTQTLLPDCPVIEEQPSPLMQTINASESKQNKCIHKEIVKDKDGTLFYCYTYLVKNKGGDEHPQKIYIKKQSGKTREPKVHRQKLVNGRLVIEDKERKYTKQHSMLIDFIDTHMNQIKSYNKFIVSRVLQDFKRENPDVKISYGLVKKVLEQQALLPANKKTYYKLD
ncbi:hypothetical protein EDI_323300 [Entamoeba dispar SAW760]|uniref:Uncharacterized protein n=1 Tax=Entamoeba dispar (strain ATCC PRA-260 / SAW760) TaxID=370354 RepID=B0EPL0_ENTDS|nr:uncharacterized protein EDI_323300 [Entamoeba dispar SAW760]EDR23547.1 hypothetical protein EDI_323300 [Entamoeba dispar SAW760]|eukprot:EDR23547.1 hypothetical protein EDI_323300 [Entamoeba dispar SAW760]